MNRHGNRYLERDMATNKKTPAKKAPAKKVPAKKVPAKKQATKKKATKKAPAKKAAAKKSPGRPRKVEAKENDFLQLVSDSVSDAQWDVIEDNLNDLASRAEKEISARKQGVIKKLLSWVKS